MIKKIALFIALTVSTIMVYSSENQKPKFDYDKFKAEKIAYFTDIIQLTPVEAQIFWPIYNEYEIKKWELIKEQKNIEKNFEESLKLLTPDELAEMAKKIAEFHFIEGKIDKEYNEKFLEILPPHKVIRMYMAEVNFRNKMLNNFRKNSR